jgi:hypothetical protein
LSIKTNILIGILFSIVVIGCSKKSGETTAKKENNSSEVKNNKLRLGKIDASKVLKVLKSHTDNVLNCYSKGLEFDKNLAGKVKVEFFVNKKGDVKGCKIAKNVSIKSVGVCICKQISTWKFPSAENGLALIKYSWKLSMN